MDTLTESKWQHSIEVKSDVAKATGCFTSLPIRIHSRNDIADDATMASIRDWGIHIGDGCEQYSGSSCSPVGNWGAFIFPEALPDRLGVITYLANLGNIHDDLCDDLTYDQAVDEHRHLSDAMNANVVDVDDDGDTNAATRMFKMKRLVAKCILEAMEIDRARALRMINSYQSKWLNVMESANPSEITDLEEYFVFRNLNGGMEPFWHLVQFGMALDVSEDEDQQIQPIFKAAEAALVLTNDYWSWDREWNHAQQNPELARIVNGVDLLMRTKGLSMNEAQDAVRQLILEYEATYIRLRLDLYRKNPGISSQLRQYIEVCGAIISGNHYWCANSPRHHAWRDGQTSFSSDGSERVGKSPSVSPTVYDNDSYPEDDETTPSSTDSVTQENCEYEDKVGAESPRLTDRVLMGPCDYIRSAPSKGIRGLLIEALVQWFPLKPSVQKLITEIVNLLHNSSLILDDIEDGSDSRRGQPATHVIFGAAQSINTANFMFVQALSLVRKLRNPVTVNFVLEELECLFLGQSWDLYWRERLEIPSEDQFLEMVDNKTGAMFRLLARMVMSESCLAMSQKSNQIAADLAQAFGRFFQVRDDLMNLSSKEYHTQKGFCEDLDEGKISYLVVLLLHRQPQYHDLVTGIFRQQSESYSRGTPARSAKVSLESKRYVLRLLKDSGTMAATLEKAKTLEANAYAMIEKMENECNEMNPVLRLILSRLSVQDVSI